MFSICLAAAQEAQNDEVAFKQRKMEYSSMDDVGKLCLQMEHSKTLV